MASLLEVERTVSCIAISCNVESDQVRAPQTYRARNAIEVGFRIIKQDINERFHTSNCGYYGKLWCYLIGRSLLLMIRADLSAAGAMSCLRREDCWLVRQFPALLKVKTPPQKLSRGFGLALYLNPRREHESCYFD